MITLRHHHSIDKDSNRMHWAVIGPAAAVHFWMQKTTDEWFGGSRVSQNLRQRTTRP